MKIKICGLNPTRDVQLCIDLKVDYLGFVFYEKSPRNVNLQDIKKLCKTLGLPYKLGDLFNSFKNK